MLCFVLLAKNFVNYQIIKPPIGFGTLEVTHKDTTLRMLGLLESEGVKKIYSYCLI